ncbi:MAG: hypothetical protein KDI56_16385 [Xanthomonadales bacterium]|nr:hypothetical protein [Xanthomonadales bacterium]
MTGVPQLSSRLNHQVVLLAIAMALSAALYWLASEFRGGFLGNVQDMLGLLFAPAYIIGALLSGNVHSPNSIGFFLGLLVQSYLIVLVVSFFVRRFTGRGVMA